MSKIATMTKRKPLSKPAAAAPRAQTVPRAAAPSASSASVRAKTLRLAPEFEAGLALLKGVLGVPINKMVNEAVGEYIRKRSAEVEADLTGVLEQVKAYRRADPHFKRARARWVDAEAKLARADPMEGVVVDMEPPAATRRKTKFRSTQTMIREMAKAHA